MTALNSSRGSIRRLMQRQVRWGRRCQVAAACVSRSVRLIIGVLAAVRLYATVLQQLECSS